MRWTPWPQHREGDNRTPIDLIWLSDSRHLVTAGDQGRIRVWDLLAPTVLGEEGIEEPPHWELDNVTRAGETNLKYELWEDPSGSRLFVGVTQFETGNVEDRSTAEAYFTIFGYEAYASEPDSALIGEPRRWPLPPGSAYMTDNHLSADKRWLLLHGVGRKAHAKLMDLGAPLSTDGARAIDLLEGEFSLNSAVFSRDGHWMAFQRAGENVRLYDLRGGSLSAVAQSGRTVEPATPQARQVLFSPDSKWLATLTGGREFHLNPLSSNSARDRITLRLPGDEAIIGDFSDDGRWLAIGSVDQVVSLWPCAEFENAPKPLEFRGLTTPVLDVAFSGDGRRIVATGQHCTYRSWVIDGESVGAMPQVLRGENHRIVEMDISPDRAWVVTACVSGGEAERHRRDGYVKLTYRRGQDSERILTAHGNMATDAVFSPDGRWLASTGRDGTAKVWSFAVLRQAFFNGTAFPSPDYVLDMRETRLQYDRQLAFHPDGRLYATCGDGVLFEWDLMARDPVRSKQAHPIHSIQYLLPGIAVSPDGQWLAVGRHGWDPPKEGSPQTGNMVLLFDVTKPGPPVLRETAPANFVEHGPVTFSADGRWMAAGAAGAGICVWDVTAPNIRASRVQSPVSAPLTTGLAFSPDGRWLALGGSDGKVHLWDWHRTGETRTIVTEYPVSTLAWLDTHQLASGGHRGRIAVWETEINALKKVARKVAGRELSAEEKQRFRIAEKSVKFDF